MIDWDNAKLPKGVTRDQFIDDIFEICHIKSYQWTVSSKAKFLSRDDLQQEMMLKCFRSISSFNPDKSFDAEAGKWKLYFYRACDSVSRDVDKKYTFNRNLPCKKCPLFDKAVGCTQFEDKLDCKPYSKWDDLNRRKFMLGTLYGSYGEDSGDAADRASALDPESVKREMPSSPVKGQNAVSREYVDHSDQALEIQDYIENKCSEDIKRIFLELCSVNYDVRQMDKDDMKKLRKELKGKFDWS